MKEEKEAYAEKLKSPYWLAYRRAVIDIYNYTCFDCGLHSKSGAMLQVHHERYHAGLEPWQYTNPDDITLLCKFCHMNRHGIREEKRPSKMMSIGQIIMDSAE